MPQVSKFLRSFTDRSGRTGYGWWCAGCGHVHYVHTDGADRPVWDFDGNLESPTFTPSYRQFIPAMAARDDESARPEQTTCHCYVTAGQIEFLNDCEHALRGFHPMTDLGTIENYGWGYD